MTYLKANVIILPMVEQIRKRYHCRTVIHIHLESP